MPLKLEVFENSAPGTDVVVMPVVQAEEMRLQAYESGYHAGWEDAVAAASADQARISAELANNLQRLSFSYHEARSQVLRSIQPLLTELTTKLLPEVAGEAIAPVVLDVLMPLLDEVSEPVIQIVLNPASRLAVEHLLTQAAGLSVTIEEEPTLGEGQVYLRLGGEELRVDLDQATHEIIRAVHDFFDLAEKEDIHG